VGGGKCEVLHDDSTNDLTCFSEKAAMMMVNLCFSDGVDSYLLANVGMHNTQDLDPRFGVHQEFPYTVENMDNRLGRLLLLAISSLQVQ
jgi:hypothetical protein